MGLLDTSIYQNAPRSAFYYANQGLDQMAQSRDQTQQRMDANTQRRFEEEKRKREQGFKQNLSGLMGSYGEYGHTPEGQREIFNHMSKAGYGQEMIGLMGGVPMKEAPIQNNSQQWHGSTDGRIFNGSTGEFKTPPQTQAEPISTVAPGAQPAAPAWKGERFVRSKNNTMVKVDANGQDQAGNTVELWSAPARPVAGPKPAPGTPGGPPTKAPTEDQSKAATFARRMELAENDLAEVEKTGYDRTGSKESALAAGPSGLNSSSGQRWSNAEKNFATANLRKESGAVIGDEEMKNQEKLYFPRWNDSPDTKEQKKRNRAQAFEGMKSAAGAQFEKVKSMVPAKTQAQNFTKPEEEDEYQAWKKEQGL